MGHSLPLLFLYNARVAAWLCREGTLQVEQLEDEQMLGSMRHGAARRSCKFLSFSLRREYFFRPKINIILGPSTKTNIKCKLSNCFLFFIRKI